MFIALYGINNIGKSTQAKLLVERLQKEGYDAVYVKYPVYDIEPTGPYLDKVLRGKHEADKLGTWFEQKISEEELQKCFAQNRHDFEPWLKGWLAEGKVVVAEDYTGTGIAWGTVKGAKTEWLEELNKDLVKEDLSILIDGERFITGKEERHLHEGNDVFMSRARQVHLELAQRYGWKKIEVVPGNIEETSERLWALVKAELSC